jgi:hypothetical protein
MYNLALQRTQSEQLLLNLVRLRYRDTPLFLEVSSVSTQYEFDGSGSVDGTIVEGSGRDSLGIGGSASYTEKPTITFIPLQGSDFVERVLKPVSLETIFTLSWAGWSLERVLRLCANHMNGLDNASRATGPTPSTAPAFEEFAEAVHLLRQLQLEGAFEVGGVADRSVLSGPIDADRVGAGDLIAAAREGYRFVPAEDGEGLVLSAPSRSLVLEIDPRIQSSEAWRRFAELLSLGADVSRLSMGEGTRQHRAPEPVGEQGRIAIGTRSLMGTLFYLANAVEVPREHVKRGLVTVTLDGEGRPFEWSEVTGDLLRVRSQTWPPIRAAIAVEHRGHWFYIDDSDLNSKSTFALLAQLLALQAGGAESVAPVLTLPIGG